jgi:hypothetical protein
MMGTRSHAQRFWMAGRQRERSLQLIFFLCSTIVSSSNWLFLPESSLATGSSTQGFALLLLGTMRGAAQRCRGATREPWYPSTSPLHSSDPSLVLLLRRCPDFCVQEAVQQRHHEPLLALKKQINKQIIKNGTKILNLILFPTWQFPFGWSWKHVDSVNEVRTFCKPSV